jgi:hypothetical protein
MRHARFRTVLGPALAGAAALLLLGGCSSLPFVAQSAAQLATGASTSWYRDAAFQFKGTLSVSEGTVDFTVTESANGSQGRGTGTLAGKPFFYLAASSNQYLKGQSFWEQYYSGQSDDQTQARGFETHYAVAGGNDVAGALDQLPDLGGDVSRLESDASAFRKDGTRTIDGQQATALAFGGDTFWVAAADTDQLVGFRATTAGRLQNVDVTIESTRLPNVSPPPQDQTVDPLQPSTLPARYSVVDATNNESACDQNTCQLQADIQNQAGAAQGISTVQLTAQDPNTNGNIASCTVSIPAIAPNQSETLSCTISGSAWNSWATNAENAGGGVAFFDVVAQITANPPYTGSGGG